MGRKFEITVPRTYEFREGYGVHIDVIFEDDDEHYYGERIHDIEVTALPIREADVSIVGGVPCVPVPDYGSMFVPVENFQIMFAGDLANDDTHDLRDRWFETVGEAEAHAEYTRNRWANPQPWESFVKLS
jgi:hypothetical protein